MNKHYQDIVQILKNKEKLSGAQIENIVDIEDFIKYIEEEKLSFEDWHNLIVK